MLVSIPLALLLAAASPSADQGADGRAAAIAPFVGEEVLVVVAIDLAKADAKALAGRVVGKLADEEDVAGVIAAIDAWTSALRKAGAHDLFVLVDPADIPGFPIAVVPLGSGADAKAIAASLAGRGAGGVIAWPASETIHGAVVAGTPDTLARIRRAEPVARPELAAALAAGGAGPALQVILIPSVTQRRAIEESVPNLPPQLGGGPITSVTRDLRWASLAMASEPSPILRAVVQAKDADAARAIQSLLSHILDFTAQTGKNDPATTALAQALGRLRPEARGDRVTFESDLEKAAELVVVPIRQAREAARRSECTNNLKQIALAMHNYHAARSAFPPAYSTSKDGKPLLSWRVHILPSLAQKALYDEFHLDEPWDSPHNKSLISRMPAAYACPSGGKALVREGKTGYLVPRGPGTIFPGAKAVKLQEITDGTSNTILVVDAADAHATTWTKPDDWEVAPDFKTEGLFGHHPGGTNFAFADGAVRFLSPAIKPKVFEALTTRNGNEVINPDDLAPAP